MTKTPAPALVVPMPKPRNPCVAAMRFRQAGAHQRAGGADRRIAKDTLRRELSSLHDGGRGRPPSP